MTSDTDLTGMSDEELTGIAAAVGRPYGMTAEQVLTLIAAGNRRHPDAPAHECGAIDPRDDTERTWCRRPLDHGTEDHNRYPDEQTRRPGDHP